MKTPSSNETVVEQFRKHKSDTGSAAVQVALLTARINHLAKHLEGNKKDHISRVGMLKMVGQRRRLLNYLGQEDQKAHKTVLTQLNLRK